MWSRLLVDHPIIKWFVVLVAVFTILFGVLQWQGNHMQQGLIETEDAWLKQDEQWNKDIAIKHEEILILIREACSQP